MWGCPIGKTGEPGVEGSPEVVKEVGGGTGAAKRETEGTEMARVRVREVKERSLQPVGWAGLTGSRSFS